MGSLSLYNNNALTDLSGLSNITSLSGDLSIQESNLLDTLDDLSSLTTVGGSLTIQNNPSLCQSLVEAFIAACTVGGTVFNSIGNDRGC